MQARSEFERLIAVLEDAAAAQDGRASQDACFRLFYRMTPAARIEYARRIIECYVTVFADHWADVAWPRELVADVTNWVSRFGRSTPDAPDALDPGDANFLHALDGLLLAAIPGVQHDPATMACAYAVVHAVEARAANVWAADDPDAVAAWRALTDDSKDGTPITPDELADFARRSVIANIAAQAVRLREWRRLATWVRGLHPTEQEPMTDQAAEDRALAAWSALEHMLPRVRHSNVNS